MNSRILRTEEELNSILENCFISPRYFIDYKGTLLPKHYTKYAEIIENFQVQNDDIWLCSFPISSKY